MALWALLAAGAESFVARSLTGRLVTTAGTRGRLTERIADAIVDAFEARSSPLTAAERAELRQIIARVNEAQRVAARLDNRERPGAGRPVKPGEVPRLPGTDPAGGDGYVYTVLVNTSDMSADGRSSLMVVVESDRLLSGAEVRARAMEMVENGTAVTRSTYRTANPRMVIPTQTTIVSVYRGSLNASRGS